jgi:hypothetical protein
MNWKDIKPLTEFEAKQIVKKYLIKHGFNPQEIKTKKLPQGKKSPDLIVYKNEKIIFYCEIKTPEHKLNPLTNMYHWDTTFNKLRRFIHTARKQFEDFDHEHKYPWVVVFTSDHPQLNWTSFYHNVIGAVAYNGKVIKNFRERSFVKNSDRDFLSLDMVIWFQVNYINRKEIFQAYFFVNQDSKLFKKTKRISDLLKPDKEK